MGVKFQLIWRAFGLSRMKISISCLKWAQERFQILASYWSKLPIRWSLQSVESLIKLQRGKGGPHRSHWQAMWLWIFKIFVQVSLNFFPWFLKTFIFRNETRRYGLVWFYFQSIRKQSLCVRHNLSHPYQVSFKDLPSWLRHLDILMTSF